MTSPAPEQVRSCGPEPRNILAPVVVVLNHDGAPVLGSGARVKSCSLSRHKDPDLPVPARSDQVAVRRSRAGCMSARFADMLFLAQPVQDTAWTAFTTITTNTITGHSLPRPPSRRPPTFFAAPAGRHLRHGLLLAL